MERKADEYNAYYYYVSATEVSIFNYNKCYYLVGVWPLDESY